MPSTLPVTPGSAGPSGLISEEELFDDPDASDSSSDYEESGSTSESETDEEDDNMEDEVVQTLPAATAETQIENDFDRLIQTIRQSDNGPSNGLPQMWDFNINDHEAEFRDDLRAASGVGKSGKGKRRKRGRTGPVLSQQVKALIGEGNQAYVDNKISEAIRVMQEVIRIEPRAAPAWSVLAQCYDDLKEYRKALQLRVMSAHLLHDSEEWDRLARQSRDMGYTEQALYCYGKVYSLDPTNVNAMWDRAALAKEFGNLRIARHALLSILKRVPHDLIVLNELRPILVETGDYALCARLFNGAFTHYHQAFPTGVAPSADESSAPLPGGGFGSMELLVLADLYNTLESYDDAIRVIRGGTRWLQGRGDQRIWDACEDDREFDAEGTIGRDGEPSPGHYPLDVNARHRLAVARIKMGDTEEGKMHAAIILAHDALDYAPLFAEVADAFFEREMYADAKPIYEALGTNPASSSIYILLQTAACRRALGELREAAEVYEHVISADFSLNDAKMKLAEIYEILNEPRKALDLVYQVIDSRRRPGTTRTGGADGSDDISKGSLFQEKGRGGRTRTRDQKRLTPDQLRVLEQEKEKEVLRSYARVKETWPIMTQETEGTEVQREAEREWLFEVERLVESFRETRRLFQSDRNPFKGMHYRITRRKATEAQEDAMASRLQLDMEYDSMQKKSRSEKPPLVTIFRGISLDDWLSLFLQYAFYLTKNGHHELADEVLSHILISNGYQNVEAQDTIRIALITCALAAKKPMVAVTYIRKIINTHQFNNEPFRLLSASLASGAHNTDAFLLTSLQKHMLREIRISDLAVTNPATMRWNPSLQRWNLPSGTGARDDEDNDDDPDILPASGEKGFLPTKNNPVGVALYGQICTVAKSYQSALFYLLHAYDYCPQDPVICLSLAIASLGRAMQRQADNRQHLIAQGMAFLSQYRSIRASEAEDETEYNFGRAFHHLGLYTLAVRHYERVLALAEGKPEDQWGMAREAAYNLSLVFVITGAAPLAKELYEKWLSI